jgi:hypothetical protein
MVTATSAAGSATAPLIGGCAVLPDDLAVAAGAGAGCSSFLGDSELDNKDCVIGETGPTDGTAMGAGTASTGTPTSAARGSGFFCDEEDLELEYEEDFLAGDAAGTTAAGASVPRFSAFFSDEEDLELEYEEDFLAGDAAGTGTPVTLSFASDEAAFELDSGAFFWPASFSSLAE